MTMITRIRAPTAPPMIAISLPLPPPEPPEPPAGKPPKGCCWPKPGWPRLAGRLAVAAGGRTVDALLRLLRLLRGARLLTRLAGRVVGRAVGCDLGRQVAAGTPGAAGRPERPEPRCGGCGRRTAAAGGWVCSVHWVPSHHRWPPWPSGYHPGGVEGWFGSDIARSWE